MQLSNYNNTNKKFVTVLSDGKFHQSVEEGTPGAIVREYEDSKGKKGSKTELVFGKASGKITDIKFEDGEYGKSIHIELDGNGIVSLSTSSSFGEDFMKKLPNVNLLDFVTLKPYSFEDDKGKNRKGITVYQNGAKIENYYYDVSTSKTCNGIPTPEGDTKKFSKDDWKMHFMVVRKFLIGEVEKLVINSDDALKSEVRTSTRKPIEEVDEDSIPIIEDDNGGEDDVSLKDIPF